MEGLISLRSHLPYDNGNKLLKVQDRGNDSYGFRDEAYQTTEFTYDTNGNLITDANKGINSVIYNHLNLPTQINFRSNNIQYVYDADGNRLKKETSDGTTTEYTNGGYIYENGNLQFFNHPEGYATPNGLGAYSYVYNYLDDLGNVRLSYTDADGNDSIDPATEIIEENNYYPFGLLQKGYNNKVSPLGNSVAKRWKFGGKEFEESFDLDTYDFGARNYMPDIGRWSGVDPLASKYARWSPYSAFANNPIMYIDPDGREPIKPFAGTVSGFMEFFNGLSSGIGGSTGSTAHAAMRRMGTVDWNMKGPKPATTGPFNTSGGNPLHIHRKRRLD